MCYKMQEAKTVNEKSMFSDSVAHRRIAIPAAGFYEWNKDKKEIILFKEKIRNFYGLQDFTTGLGRKIAL